MLWAAASWKASVAARNVLAAEKANIVGSEVGYRVGIRCRVLGQLHWMNSYQARQTQEGNQMLLTRVLVAAE
jgi:hypothetical protein